MKQKIAASASLLIVAGLIGFSIFLTPISMADVFDQNKIIDDAVFDNNGTMTADQVDSWLNTYFGSTSCISTSHGFSAPDPTGYNPTQGFLYGSNVSAGKIIYDAAQAYGINPQVLLATLQKEQSLVDGSAGCSTLRYAAATGYGCPDGGTTYSYSGLNLYTINGVTTTSVSGTCVNSPLKAGFSQQVIRSAWLLKFGEQRSEGNINWAVIKGNWDNSDDPQTCYGGPMTQGTWQRCPSGGSAYYDGYTTIDNTSVHMDNGATAALYWYTPHFPGNENFFTIFTSWFGSTRGTPFFQISGSVKTYMIGANNTYYYITTPSIMNAYGYGTTFTRISQEDSSYLNGLTYNGTLPLIARFEGDGVYAAADGKLHPFPSSTTFTDYGYSFGQEATLPAWMLQYVPQAEKVTNVLRQSDSAAIYYVTGGKAQPFCTWSAYTTLGTPTYFSQAYVTLNHAFASTLALGAPIATDGTLISATDASTYGVWDGTQLMPISADVAKASGLINCGVPTASLSQLTVGTTTLNNLAQDSSNNEYILDGSRKLLVSGAQQANLAIPAGNFVTADDTFMARFTQASMSNLYRVNNGDGVYDIISGHSYAIPSPDDLYGLGYDFGQVLNVSASTSALFPSSGVVYRPGRLVRIGNQDAVYLLDTGFTEHAFPSAATFLNYGYTWGQVASVGPTGLQAYAAGSSVSQYAQDGSGVYWLVDSGGRHKVSSTLTAASYYNISSANSTSLSSTVLNNIPTSQDLTKVFRAGNQDAVYLIENGTKRPYTSSTAFLSQGYTWTDVISLSPSYVSSLPTGAPIN